MVVLSINQGEMTKISPFHRKKHDSPGYHFWEIHARLVIFAGCGSASWAKKRCSLEHIGRHSGLASANATHRCGTQCMPALPGSVLAYDCQ
jgi:hypothetical protein